MPIDPRRIEVIDDVSAAILRKMSGAERLDMGRRMFRSMRAELVHFLRTQHPEWSEEQVRREVARRVSGGRLECRKPGSNGSIPVRDAGGDCPISWSR